MYAVIKTGGKQYKVAPEQTIVVEKLLGDTGSVIEFDQILAVGNDSKRMIGEPLVEGAGVRATIVEHRDGDKVVVFKKKRRKDYRRKKGHRQELTAVRINEIVAEGFKKGAAKKAVPKTDKSAAAVADETSGGEAATEETPAVEKATVKKRSATKSAAKRPAARKPAARKPAAKTKSAPKGNE